VDQIRKVELRAHFSTEEGTTHLPAKALRVEDGREWITGR
jgi:hypothetical protein